MVGPDIFIICFMASGLASCVCLYFYSDESGPKYLKKQFLYCGLFSGILSILSLVHLYGV